MEPKNQVRQAKNPITLTVIGATLKDERMKIGLTQAQASQQLSISLKSLRNLEQGIGGVPLSTVMKILTYFGKELRVGDIAVSPQPKRKLRPRKDQVLEMLRLIRPILSKKFHVIKIAVFGSVARDEATKNSDIDIAVVFDAEQDFELIGKLVAFLETLFDGQKVDLVEERKLVREVKVQSKKDFIYVT
jgi:predicted nucleotidyltransferase